tara:strand:+ start:331 stop:504 length:174 start_codon:yes stop_codon:yes gene_type:complete
MKPKNLLKSKTFWMQVLSIAAAVSGVIPMAPETTAIVVGLINIALRAVTKDPVHIGL